MAKFSIECPKCGTYQKVSNGIFSKKKVNCKCGFTIDVKKDKYVLNECPHCGNKILTDQSKKDKAECPVCKKKVVTEDIVGSKLELSCPTCSCIHHIDKNSNSFECTLCGSFIDVPTLIEKEKIKNSNLASLIKYEGPNNVLIWKHPVEDFNIGSQLIVHESQEAILFRDGKALDLFGAGRYTLSTAKIPLLNELYKLPVDQNIFHSEVYFVNTVTQTGVKWGTDSKVRLFDPISGLHVELGASGEFTIKVANSRKLLVKLVGTTNELRNSDIVNAFETKAMTGKFKALIVSKVKSTLASIIKAEKINILEVDAHIETLSDALKKEINETLEGYGLTLPEFYITNILTPDDDPNYRKMKEQYAEQYLLVRDEQIKKNVAMAEQERRVIEAKTEAQEEIIAAQAKAEAYRLQAEAEAREMQMKGYSYQQETQRMVGVSAVENQGSINAGGTGEGGSMIGNIVGLGVTLGAVGGVVGMTKDALGPITDSAKSIGSNVSGAILNENAWNCSCGKTGITSNFCPNCGAKMPTVSQGWTCSCGNMNIKTNFCPNCGSKKPMEDTWTCICGNTLIKSNFCPNCGAKKPEDDSWDCECGQKDIKSNFCPACGKKGE